MLFEPEPHPKFYTARNNLVANLRFALERAISTRCPLVAAFPLINSFVWLGGLALVAARAEYLPSWLPFRYAWAWITRTRV